MNIKLIKAELEKLSLMLSSWEQSEQVSAIERDIVLDKLKSIYDAVRFDAAIEQSAPSTPIAPVPATPAPNEEDEESAEKEVEVELIFADDEFPEEVLVDEDIADNGSVSATDIIAATVADAIGDAVATEDSNVNEEAETVNDDADEEATESVIEVSTPAIEVVAPTIEPEPEVEPMIEVETELEIEPEPEPMIEIEPIIVPEPISEPIAEPTPAPKEEIKEVSTPTERAASEPKRTMNSLFNMEEVRRQPRSKHQRMMSIYNDNEATQEKVVDISKIFNMEIDEPEEVKPTVEPIVVPKPIEKPAEKAPLATEEKPTTLADVISAPQTLADTIAAPTALAEEINHTRLHSLRDGIGLNDKFLMIRDLFDGDADAYEQAIKELDELESMDDCVIHIIENYEWNPDSEGSKFIMQLLERKLS